MISNTVPKNGSSEVYNKPVQATVANSQEKLRSTMASMALRAHSYYWKTLGDTYDSLPALIAISSLDDAKSIYHLCGIYDKNTAKFIKTNLEMFLSTMDDRTIIEMVDYCTLGRKREKFLRLGHLKRMDSIAKPKLQYKKGSLVQRPNKTTNVVQLSPSERDLLSKLVDEAKANIADTVPKNGTSEVYNKSDIARLANCQEKLRMIMESMAL